MKRAGTIACWMLLVPGLAGAETLAERDRAAIAAAERAAASVVRIEVERSTFRPRALTRAERAALGVLDRAFDPRYFVRPAGPSSGVVIAPHLVATSAWNVEGEGALTVIGSEGVRHPARRVGVDHNLKVALLEVEPAPDLRPCQPAGAPVPGRGLLLVGRTRDGEALVTRGVVSGLGRARGEAFVHSARTSFANSGGALVDLEGRLLGISVRHQAKGRAGQASGVGFGAAWVRLAPHLETLGAGTSIPARPTAYLGVEVDIRYAGFGARVRKVFADAGAARGGLRAEDVIRIFNSREIQHYGQLVDEIESLEIGAEIIITVSRGPEEIDLRVTLGARPKER